MEGMAACAAGCAGAWSAAGRVRRVGGVRRVSPAAAGCGSKWGAAASAGACVARGGAGGLGMVFSGDEVCAPRKEARAGHKAGSKAPTRGTRARTLCMAAGEEGEKRAVPMTTRPNAVMRFTAILPYVLPLVEGLVFGRAVFAAFPIVALLLIPFAPMLQFYHSSSFTPFLVFFSLYLLVVRNVRIPHFIRFNAMQAILIDISQMLAGLIVSYLPREIAVSVVGEAMSSMVFLGSLSAVGYSVFKTLCGVYADMPIVSEAVFIQVQA